MNVADNEISELLLKYKKFSVYGLSPNEKKSSLYVQLYMVDHGWDVVVTYPKPHTQGVFKIYSSLKEVPIE
jgi:predicted CoA-binding protein